MAGVFAIYAALEGLVKYLINIVCIHNKEGAVSNKVIKKLKIIKSQ